MSQEIYYKRKSKGICVRCGKKPASENRVMCAECAEGQKLEIRETRKYFREMGLCPRCGKNKLFGSERECLECSARMYTLSVRSREKRNLSNREYYKRDKARLEREGLCRRCRKNKADEGHIYCKACLIIHRERSRLYRIKTKENKCGIARSERPSYGLCYTCGNPLDRDGRICIKCSGIMTNNLPAENVTKHWREDNKMLFKH